MQVHAANINQDFEFADISAQVLERYAEGKTPALAVKSALQLGFSVDVIAQLPGMTLDAYHEGRWLIDSGAFVATATGTVADGPYTGSIDLHSAQVEARQAAGLDPYGFPAGQVELMRAAGAYVDLGVPMLTPDQQFMDRLFLHVSHNAPMYVAPDYRITESALLIALHSMADIAAHVAAAGITDAQVLEYAHAVEPLTLVGIA